MQDDEIHRLRSAWAAAGRGAAAGPGCPEPGRIWSGVAGALSPADLARLVDHSSGCPACAEAWRLARELRRGARQPAAQRRARPRARWLPLAAALAAVALGGSVLLRRPAPGGGPAPFREGRAGVVGSLLVDGQALHASRFALRWAPGPPGTRYDVELVSAGLDAIARARGLEQPSFRVPEAQLRGVPPGSRLYWRVEALLPDGTRVRSDLFSVRLER